MVTLYYLHRFLAFFQQIKIIGFIFDVPWISLRHLLIKTFQTVKEKRSWMRWEGCYSISRSHLHQWVSGHRELSNKKLLDFIPPDHLETIQKTKKMVYTIQPHLKMISVDYLPEMLEDK